MRHACWMWLICLLGWGAAWGQDNPVTNGSFEVLDAAGRPIDWEILGEGRIVSTAHSGARALLLDRQPNAPGETGLNRRWQPHSGEQGAMLSERKGGLEFYYQVPKLSEDAKIVIGVIPMNAEPLEGTGSPRTMYEVPRAHVGDGQWHRGLLKYDYTDNDKVKWIHVAARIVGGAGQLLLDDIRWLPSVGPLPKIEKMTLTEAPEKAGEEAILRVRLRNVGDQPLRTGRASLVLPEGLQAAPARIQDVPELAPDDISYVQWTIAGRREQPGVIAARLACGEQIAEERLTLAPKIVIEQLRADRFVLAPGEKTNVRLFIRNEGNVAVRGLKAQIADTPAIAERKPQTIALLRPGERASVAWTASLREIGQSARVTAELFADDRSLGKAGATILCARPMPDVPSTKAAIYAQIWPNGAVVGNEHVRLVLAVDRRRQAGPAWLQVRQGKDWRTVGVMPYLGYIALQPECPSEALQPLEARVEKAANGSLTLSGKDVSWTLKAEQGPEIAFRLTYRASRTKEIYGLHGPLLYVGEGSWGAAKTEAIFPGLEWLTAEEESSSTLDIAAHLAQRWRWCPPPHAVTIPCMGLYHEGVTVGLIWDHLQQTYRNESRPRAIFAVPDRFEGRNASLMGLMAPGGKDDGWWVPPRLGTGKPLTLQAGETISLSARLYAQAGTQDATAVIDRWAVLYGIPEPQRLPHGRTLHDEIAFSARGYLEALWNPEKQQWFASLNGPNMMATLGWHPAYLYDVVYAARLASDPKIRQACAERAALVERLSGQKPVADDMGFEFGNPIAHLIGRAEQVSALMRGQGEDGAWRFRARIEKHGIFAGMDYGELGPDQAAEVGTCAQTAYTILHFARLTGDPEATAAGLKALEFMKRFSVPRAAQVWEVPVHTPDVLASADACEAYLEGYLITGDRQYLERAVYWARTGIMFNYMWDIPGYEALRYASIPVLGATWFTGSWFGQPVQWNGLRLARAYAKLAEYDQSYPWRRMAEGLMISAMWQQHGKQFGGRDIWPDTNEKWIALWPDNFNSITLQRCPWVFAPRQILDLAYRFLGLHPSPETMIVGPRGQEIRINACADIREASLQGERLTAVIQPTPPQTTQIVVCNLARPQGVRINGIALPEIEGLAGQESSGWEYFPAFKALLVRPPAAARWQLEITGARFERGRFAVPLATRLEFDFVADAEGWRAAHDLTEPVVREGLLEMRTTGTDPYFVRGSLDIAPDSVKRVVIRLAVAPGTRGDLQVFWTTADSPAFEEAKSLRVPLIADGELHDYIVPVGTHPLWAGKRITGFRLDPGGGPAHQLVRLDFVRGLPE